MEKKYCALHAIHSPANTIRVFSIVSLCAVLDVVEHNDTGDKVDRLACREEIQIGPAVTPAVAIAKIQ